LTCISKQFSIVLAPHVYLSYSWQVKWNVFKWGNIVFRSTLWDIRPRWSQALYKVLMHHACYDSDNHHFSRIVGPQFNLFVCIQNQTLIVSIVFFRLCRYFSGNHHLEEIMYYENLRRNQLLTLLEKFRKVLFICQHEDPATVYHTPQL
jgi:hypothetical protein